MQMPEDMRTVAGAAFFLSLSIANFIGSLIVICQYRPLGGLNFAYFNLFASGYLMSSKGNGTTEVLQENPIGGRMGESLEAKVWT